MILDHGAFIDEEPAQVLVAAEQHVDVAVFQLAGRLLADADLSGGVHGLAPHGEGDAILRGDEQELLSMPPAHGILEEGPKPEDEPALPRARLAVDEG